MAVASHGDTALQEAVQDLGHPCTPAHADAEAAVPGERVGDFPDLS
ncbi:hypothetical protein [Streptomyces sp. NPDC001401]